MNRDVRKTKNCSETRWELGGWVATRSTEGCAVSSQAYPEFSVYVENSQDCRDLIRVLQEVFCDLRRAEVLDKHTPP